MSPPAQIVVRRKIVALLLAVAFGCASLGSAAHRAIVRHVACEHGQLVEVSASFAQAPVDGRSTTLSIATAHQHHHCALDGFHAPVLQRASQTSVSFDPTWRTLVLALVAHDRAPLVYAPKTSPPV